MISPGSLRQSSASQVENNRESTERQYALSGRARELGWPAERVMVIDEDLGLSGSGSVVRSGFARLTSEVALARVGIVLGLEVSRLARNNADWHRLIELAGLTDTLIADADGLYHPALFNDRLLLGLKGAMSEAELHVLRARLNGGIKNKAARGELRRGLPIGFVWGEDDGEILLHPDEAVVTSALPPRPCAPSSPIPSTWAPRSASSPCCTVGARTCFIIPICIASSRAVACPSTASDGSPAGPASSSRSAFSRACSGVCFCNIWKTPSRPANCSSSPPSVPCASATPSGAIWHRYEKPRGWSTPSRPSPDPSRSSITSAATRTASPSPTIASSTSMMAPFVSAGRTIGTAVAKRS